MSFFKRIFSFKTTQVHHLLLSKIPVASLDDLKSKVLHFLYKKGGKFSILYFYQSKEQNLKFIDIIFAVEFVLPFNSLGLFIFFCKIISIINFLFELVLDDFEYFLETNINKERNLNSIKEISHLVIFKSECVKLISIEKFNRNTISSKFQQVNIDNKYIFFFFLLQNT